MVFSISAASSSTNIWKNINGKSIRIPSIHNKQICRTFCMSRSKQSLVPPTKLEVTKFLFNSSSGKASIIVGFKTPEELKPNL